MGTKKKCVKSQYWFLFNLIAHFEEIISNPTKLSPTHDLDLNGSVRCIPWVNHAMRRLVDRNRLHGVQVYLHRIYVNDCRGERRVGDTHAIVGDMDGVVADLLWGEADLIHAAPFLVDAGDGVGGLTKDFHSKLPFPCHGSIN